VAELPHLARLLLLLGDPCRIEIGQRRRPEVSPRERPIGRAGHVGPGSRAIAGGIGEGRGRGQALGAQRIVGRAELRRAAIQPGRVAVAACGGQLDRGLVQTVRLDRADDGGQAVLRDCGTREACGRE
jgi:hypothetical protein